MKKRKPYRYVVCSDSRLSWQIVQSAWTLGIFLLLLSDCAILSDLARSNRAMLHLSHPSGTPLESLPASTPCRAIEITAPDSHIREAQREQTQRLLLSLVRAKESDVL